MIYLDNNATTQPDPPVVAAMTECLTANYGNPSSTHRFGQEARQAVEQARYQVAQLLNCTPRELVFTSGGTEADNAAILGILATRPDAKTIVTSAVEHSAVRQPLEALAKRGYQIVTVGVDTLGRLEMGALELVLGDPAIALVSIMWANNETGVIFDSAAIGALTRRYKVPLHVDGVQAAGKLPIDLLGIHKDIDLLSISGHKFHGPKGVGALFVRRGVNWSPLLRGGPQERDRRGGTENVAGIVGMGKAAELARVELAAGGGGSRGRITALRDRLERGILERVADSQVIGDPGQRVDNTTNIAFAALEAEAILLLLSERELCASAGAACSSGSLEPSAVLRAMHLPERIAHGAIRFSLSHNTTESEIDQALEIIPAVIARLRQVLPVG